MKKSDPIFKPASELEPRTTTTTEPSNSKRIIPSETSILESKTRQVLPTSRGSVSSVSRISDTQGIMEDAKATLAKELFSMKSRSFSKGLDIKEVRVLNQLIDSLIKISREEREAVKEDGIEDKSDEELVAEIKELMKNMDNKD